MKLPFNLTIKNKLILLGALSITTLLLLSGISYWANTKLSNANADLSEAMNANNIATQIRVARLQMLVSRFEGIYQMSHGQSTDETISASKENKTKLANGIKELEDLKLSYIPKETFDVLNSNLPIFLKFNLEE